MWDKIKLLTSDVWRFIWPSIRLFLTEAGKALLLSAVAAVREAEAQPGLKGRQKYDYALSKITTGLPEREINRAIEIALGTL